MKDIPILTFDIDWAPDFILEEIVPILKQYNIKSTWFATHESSIIRELEKDELFEVGIHPNFQKNSSHGRNPEEILIEMTKLFPNAKSVRTHSLFQSSPLLALFHKFGIENDLSLLLENCSSLHPFFSSFFRLYRFPCFWEDDVMMSKNYDLEHFSTFKKISGLKIFNFHPIHIFLNSKNLEKYNEIKTSIGLSNITKSNIQKFINNNTGTKSFFLHLIEFMKGESTYTINDLQRELRCKNDL